MIRRRTVAALAAGALTLSACGSQAAGQDTAVRAEDWSAVLGQARGQTVNFYTYGGDQTLNSFLRGYVADRLRRDGVTLNQVRISDTGDAINKLLGQKQAGRTSGGSVDAVWVNGENFATGRQADLWWCGWPRSLPNARYVDFADPAVSHDFGRSVDGCEAVWQRADSALVYDSADLKSTDVASVSTLLDWARRHPGRFTYAAPPDFTGSMTVRTILYDTVGGPDTLPGDFDEAAYAPAAKRLWARLNALKPALWRQGDTYPQSQDQVEQLFAQGQISAYFTYGPGAVADKVGNGSYPRSTREAVPAPGNIANDSFVAIPADAGHRAAALVLANLLQDPGTQLALYRAEGIYPGIDLGRTTSRTRAGFAAVPVNPSVLPLTDLSRRALPELGSGYIARIEKDWKTHVLER